jgi:hypothetical protein
MTEENVTLYPEWRQAVRDFFEDKFKEGDVISKTWLEAHFGMEPIDGLMSAEDFQKRQFEWLQNVESFRTELLEQHQICLSVVYGEGYRVVPPGEQTTLAQEKFEREAAKAYKRAALTLKNVRQDQLTDAQRKENMDAIAKLSMLRGMHKGALEA